MSRKTMAVLGALALASTAVLSVPAFAQTDNNDDTLWLVGWGATGAAILTLILTSDPHAEVENPPASP